MMKAELIEDYIERVYGYAVRHTYSRDEADELSQEILLTVVRELPKSGMSIGLSRGCGASRRM